MKHAPRPNTFRDAWAGDLTAARCGDRGPRGRLGPPPPRPRRADLHRPARPLGARAARRPSRRPPATPSPLAEDLRSEHVVSAEGEIVKRAPENVNPNLATGEIEIHVRSLRAPGRQRDAALRRRRGRAGRRDAAPAAPHARPAPRAHARGDGAAPPVVGHHARRPQRARLPGDRDADPHALHARGRARLPRPQPPAAGLVVRAAAVAPAVQAAADDGRLRALLPDRPLLPRRGPARRPPARVHPARRRDVLRRRGRRHRDDRGRDGRGVRGRRLRRAGRRRGRAWRFDEAMLRFGSDRPDRRFDLEIVDVSQALRGSEFKVFESVLGGGGAVRALNAGAREMSRSELEGLNEVVQRHGGKAVAWGFVEDGALRSPIAKFLGEDRVAAAVGELRRVRGRPAAVRGRPAARRGRGARRAAPGARPALRPHPRGRPRRAVGRRLPDVRAQRRRLGRACTTRSPRPRGDFADPGRDALARLRPDRSTAGSSAAARSASTRPRSRSRSSRSSA